ncbi:uncharacterized protein TEOVI_000179300 [Trypanosoma equiperdum]|uniref:Uncharacterized protein n=1 Tax=Trypanosoma equiperdum TaxID=5694 RepID=A0A1G4ID87_TRYEQ|nr:hypothetical protein, conserved [Trypanosoma equiperdum]
MNLELYVTLADLSRLPRGEPHDVKTLICRADTVRAPRPRELLSGRVFDISGQLLDTEYKGMPGETCVHVFFYDEWASAASFIERDDIVILKGFTVYDTPRVGDHDVEFPFFVTPIPHMAALRALQKGHKDDIMEVTVTADALETPNIRVMPKRLRGSYIANDMQCPRTNND